MADLRQSLNVLVERPLATPPAVDVVAARAAQFGRRRRTLYGAGLAVVAVASAAMLGVARQGSEPGVVLASGSATAGYIAENPGGYVAVGTWRITITRGPRVIELSNTANGKCGAMGVIQPGDEVRGSIAGRESSLRVGERFSCPE